MTPGSSVGHHYRTDLEAAAILAADPVLAQDIADGEALRLLREFMDPTVAVMVRSTWRPHHPKYDEPEFEVTAEWWSGRDRMVEGGYGSTIAAAADACREALEKS